MEAVFATFSAYAIVGFIISLLVVISIVVTCFEVHYLRKEQEQTNLYLHAMHNAMITKFQSEERDRQSRNF